MFNFQTVATLFSIKCEVEKIEAKLDHPETGLVEIKREIRGIIHALEKFDLPFLQDIKCEVEQIEAKLDHPTTGLVEIKREIRDILKFLNKLDLSAVLTDISREVAAIEAKLDNPATGLVEIKNEIADILNTGSEFAFAMVRTTGPFVRREGLNSVVVVVLNNTSVTQTVTVTVFTFEPQCPKIPVAGSPLTVALEPFCSFTGAFDVTANNNYEVQVESQTGRGIFAFAAGRPEAATDPVFPGALFGSHVALDADFIPQLTVEADC